MSCNQGLLEFCGHIFASFFPPHFIIPFIISFYHSSGNRDEKDIRKCHNHNVSNEPNSGFQPPRYTEDSHLKTGEFSFYLSESSGVRFGLSPVPHPLSSAGLRDLYFSSNKMACHLEPCIFGFKKNIFI